MKRPNTPRSNANSALSRTTVHKRIPFVAVVLLAACADSHPATAPAVPTAAQFSVAAGVSVVVAPASTTLMPGYGAQLTAAVRDPAGKPYPNLTLAWSSSDRAIATVTNAGLVNTVAPGTVTITAATAGGNAVLTGTATITVTALPLTCPASAPNLHSPVGTTTKATGIEDTPLLLQLTATDGDLPCDSFTFRVTQIPAGGFLHQVAADGAVTSVRLTSGTVVTNPNGLIAFVPSPNASGLPLTSVAYVVLDAAGHSSAGETLEIDIPPVNDSPVAVSATQTGANNSAVTDVNLNVVDVESGPSVTICLVELARDGDLYWMTTNPSQLVRSGDCRPTTSLKYVARSQGFSCTMVSPSSYPRTDSFKWRAFDGEAYSNTATDKISIVYVNSPPVFTGPFDVRAQEDASVQFALTASDLDGDFPRYTITALPAHGTLRFLGTTIVSVPTLLSAVGGATPQLTYVPNADFNTSFQSEEFRVQVRDAAVRNCDYVVRVNVTAGNDAPVITAPPTLSAARASDGTVIPAQTGDIRVADDARPGDLLRVRLRAQGAAAGRVDVTDAAGLINFQQISPTEIRFEGTLTSINGAFGRGVVWTPNTGGELVGELVVIVDDQGSFGLPNLGPLVTTMTIPVNVAADIVLLRSSGGQSGVPSRVTTRPLPRR